jgi:A/G-specific adenine glycosylase
MSTGNFSHKRQRESFRSALLKWYDANKRDLPWRRSSDPYRIWLSEIMLQQTRVGAVLDHYRRFLERFPNIHALARAREQSVLAAWSGLGYYRRARNLHACAKVVSAEREGKFPETAEELQELPGIGRYTAAAIASIAFNQPNAVVDGNVERVLQRVSGKAELSSAETWELAGRLLSPERPGDLNQAMMELGATVCLPKEPQCLICPVIKLCATRGAHPREKREERNVRELALGWSHRDRSVWLVQRSKTLSLMPGMWELPEVEPNGHAPMARFKHSILDTDYNVSLFAVEIPAENGRWIAESRLSKMALTGLARKVLRHYGML